MRAQPRLLQCLINYWDMDKESFILDGQPMKTEVEAIYFLTELSHCGEVPILKSENVGGMNIEEYIAIYCAQNTQKVGSQIPMCAITKLGLKIIIMTIQRIIGSTTGHSISRVHMF